MSLPVIVLGGGGHAKVLIEALQLSAADIIGVTDSKPILWNTRLLGVPVLGGDEVLERYRPGRVMLVNGLGSVGPPHSRMHLFEKYLGQGYDFATVIHPSAVLARDLQLGRGVQIMAGAVIQPGVVLCDNVIVNTRGSIDHDSYVGSHTHLAPGVTLSGQVTVGSGVHIGTGAAVVNNIQIGSNSLIGAGSMVLRDIPEAVTAYGVPAKIYPPR